MSSRERATEKPASQLIDQRIVCTGEAYAKVVKLTFARGAMVPDLCRRRGRGDGIREPL